MRKPIFLWILLLVAAQSLLAQPTFFRKDILVGVNPRAVAAGDFDGDGRPDLVCATDDGLFTLLNAGSGTFGDPVRTEMATTTRLLVGDFNNDGKDDIVSGGAVMLSLGDGAFERSQGELGGIRALGDFNGDQNYDLLASVGKGPEDGFAWDGVVIWLGNGDGTFQRGPTVTTKEPGWGYFGAAADFNEDGRTDVLLRNDGEFLVFLGHGDGTFEPAVLTSAGSWTLFFLADFNGDGFPDVATEDRILLGDGDGNFTRSVWYGTFPDGKPIIAPAFTRWPIAATDVNGDGDTDLVLYSEYTDSLLVRPSKGDGSFLPPVQQTVGWVNPGAAAAADLDGDGLTDLVTANSLSGTLSALLSRTRGEPSLRRAVSAASGTAIVAPGSLAILYAPTPVTATLTAFPPWPTQLGSIGLEVKDSEGVTRLAPLVSVLPTQNDFPTQINFQVPAESALGETTLFLVVAGESTEVGSMQVEAVAPGLFMISPPNAIPAANAILVTPDAGQIGIPVSRCSPSADAIDCWLSGIPLSNYIDQSIYVSFYGTGFRDASADNVTCTIDGIPVPVVYAGPQETPGVDQINVRLVPELLYGRHYGEVVTIRINGVPANSIQISVR